MANIFPDFLSEEQKKERRNDGELQVRELLKKLPDDFYIWDGPRIGQQERYPDFVVWNEDMGLLVIEVKSWSIDQVKYADRKIFKVEINLKKGEENKDNPYEQSIKYANNLKRQLEEEELLRHTTGINAGKLKFPIGSCVFFTRIRRDEAKRAGILGDIIDEERCFFADDLLANSDAEIKQFIGKMKKAFRIVFKFERLEKAAFSRLQDILYPRGVGGRDIVERLDLEELTKLDIKNLRDAVSDEIDRQDDVKNRQRHFIFDRQGGIEFRREKYIMRFARIAKGVQNKLESNFGKERDYIDGADIKINDQYLKGDLRGFRDSNGDLEVCEIQINRGDISQEELERATEPNTGSAGGGGIEYISDGRDFLKKINGFFEDLLAGDLPRGGNYTPIKILSDILEKVGPKGPNESQKRAIETACKQKITYIWGPPGTGKTTVLAAIALILAKNGKRVLICSTGHEAKNNAIRQVHKIASSLGYNMERKIAIRGMNPGVKENDKDIFRYTRKAVCLDNSRSAWAKYEKESEIVGAVLASLTPEDIRNYDYVIIDEISMADIPSLAVAALCSSYGLILVGDPYQLPASYPEDPPHPNRYFRDNIFFHAKLVDDDGEVVRKDNRLVSLDVQYRMHPEIGSLVSRVFYDGKLENGIKDDDSNFKAKNPWGEGRILFFDHGHESRLTKADEKNPKYNTFHAETIARKIIPELIRAGNKAEDIGVIVPYNAQLAEINAQMKKSLKDGDRKMIKTSTVHSFQGQEKPIIILDFTDDDVDPTPLTAKRQLINVAVSRAQSLLILVGNAQYLKTYYRFSDKEKKMFQEIIRHAKFIE